MGFKEILSKLGEHQRAKKELLREADEQVKIQRIVEERQLSSDERELLRYQRENRAKQVKAALEVARKERQNDIDFGHNILDTKNITNNSQWEIMKDRNIFVNSKSNLLNDRRLFTV
jgi:LPS O-antigen subunit length determinant protein (WzzB/FepE family)